MRARKRFGQHFLRDQETVRCILEQFHPTDDDFIVEIGPGRGALTEALLQRVNCLHAVEIDRDLIQYLSNQFPPEQLVLHQSDVLTFDFTSLTDKDTKLRLIGNLPYNISSPLLFHLMEYTSSINDMCFMLQKEVVQRLVAHPGNKDYGRLTVMMACRCDIEYLFDVPPESFTPTPKVDSSVVSIRPHTIPKYSIPEFTRFSNLVKRAFGQRRKTLRNSLKGMIDDDVFSKASIDSSRRSEQLTIDEFVRLCDASSSANCR